MKIELRRVTGDEMLQAMYWSHAYAFGSSPPLRDRDGREDQLRRRKGATFMAAYEGDEVLASGSSRPMMQQIRGALLPMAGLLDISTHPTARRRGIARRLIVALLEAVRAEGAVVSGLYPFRESFYERLGYVTLHQLRRITLDPAYLESLFQWEMEGEVRLLSLDEGYDAYRAFLEEHRSRVHGMALFEPDDRAAVRRNDRWVALAQVNGKTQGAMLYALRGEETGRYAMHVSDFYYESALGRYLLLEWIARHIGQSPQVQIFLPAYEQPETWLADLQLYSETAQHITPMVRILDVARLNGLNTGPGSVTLRVTDPICPWNEGVWRMETVDGCLQVESSANAQGDISVQGLTGLVYGTHDPGDFSLRGWGSLSQEVATRLRVMFSSERPHLHEHF